MKVASSSLQPARENAEKGPVVAQAFLSAFLSLWISHPGQAFRCEACVQKPFLDHRAIIDRVLAMKRQPECKILMAKGKIPAAGTSCKTTNGGLFLRLKDGWLDLGPKGKFWQDGIANGVDLQGARQFCARSPLARVPSKEDYLVAERHGFREVLNDMVQYFYWSQSEVAGQGSYGFSASTGALALMGADKYAPYVVGRCIRDPQ